MEILLNHRTLFKYGMSWNVRNLCISVQKNFNLIWGNVGLFVNSSHREVLYIKKAFLKISHLRVRFRG